MFIRYDDYSESFDEDDEENSEVKFNSSRVGLFIHGFRPKSRLFNYQKKNLFVLSHYIYLSKLTI